MTRQDKLKCLAIAEEMTFEQITLGPKEDLEKYLHLFNAEYAIMDLRNAVIRDYADEDPDEEPEEITSPVATNTAEVEEVPAPTEVPTPIEVPAPIEAPQELTPAPVPTEEEPTDNGITYTDQDLRGMLMQARRAGVDITPILQQAGSPNFKLITPDKYPIIVKGLQEAGVL